MLALNAILTSVLAVLATGVTADFIPAGSAAHFFTSQSQSSRVYCLGLRCSLGSTDPTLVFAPEFAGSGADLVAANPGDGSSADITALTAIHGTGVPTQIAYGDFCITSDGVVPGTATQILFVTDCDSSDPTQLWTINEEPATVSNADGNCITLGRAAKGVTVRHRQTSTFQLPLYR
ncbi:hypothetical protein C2E23DRAFT_800890 [Lenzites betulinus]|nr:hypothetical protein C2E23DRAFT_800890 [Lenzites betulinus]